MLTPRLRLSLAYLTQAPRGRNEKTNTRQTGSLKQLTIEGKPYQSGTQARVAMEVVVKVQSDPLVHALRIWQRRGVSTYRGDAVFYLAD